MADEHARFRGLLATNVDLSGPAYLRGIPRLEQLRPWFAPGTSGPRLGPLEESIRAFDALDDEPTQDTLYDTSVRFPFTHFAPSRYSAGVQYGVWYAAAERETALRETAQGVLRNYLDRPLPAPEDQFSAGKCLVSAHANALTPDLVSAAHAAPELVADDRAFCQRLGEWAWHRGAPGLWYPSARLPRGRCVAIFKEALIHTPSFVDSFDVRLRHDANGITIEAAKCQWWIAW